MGQQGPIETLRLRRCKAVRAAAQRELERSTHPQSVEPHLLGPQSGGEAVPVRHGHP
jgi:hypothetical protein